jgi:hypothetical protein
MGDYIIHFDDGSEALAHYGKKGMHWGEWNEETRRRYMEHPDLIGDFAKMLNQGGASINKALTDSQKQGKSPYELHAYNQSFQDAKRMTPAEAGIKNVGAVVNNMLKDASATLSSIGRSAVLKGATAVALALGEVATQARYLTEGFRPTIRDDSTSGRADKWTKLGYTPQIIDTDESKTKPHSLGRMGQHISQDSWDYLNYKDLSKYNKSVPKKLRNLVGLK